VKPGDRIKTDSRDARKLASLLRAGLLTEVFPPTEDEEAVRDLSRCREDATQDLLRSRHRLGKYLLRRGLVYGVKQRAWTARHRLWLRGLRFERSCDQTVFNDYLLAVENLEERLKSLEDALTKIAGQAPYAEPVGWLRCFRGIDTITAMMILTEIHDFRRFRTARGFMAYLGLTPSENSSGDRRRLGGITHMGNSHVRRVIIQSAWHHRHRPTVSRKLKQRREGQPAHIIALADKAQHRLCRRFRAMMERGKHMNKAVVAIGRELAGFIWAVLHSHSMRTV
jgi:transposase